MRFFILMPLIPGLILWAVVTVFRYMAAKGRQIQAENECLNKDIRQNIQRRTERLANGLKTDQLLPTDPYPMPSELYSIKREG